jgi:hypothetical protein
MSPQPGRADKSPRVATDVGEDLVFSEGPRSLALPKLLMAQIWVQVYQGLRTLARGGLEVGGLLVGPKADEGRVVDGIIPLPIEYRHGPLYRMSSTDLASIGPAIESVQSDPLKAVIGFYRSRTRGDGTLRESDREIFDAIEQAHLSFALDFRCCFVLAPMSESVALACLAFRGGDGWDEMHPVTLGSDLDSLSALPSSTGLLQMPHRPDKEEYSIGSPVALSAAKPVTDHRVPEPSAVSLAVSGPQVRRPRTWLYAAAFLSLAGGVAGAYRWALRTQSHPTANVRTFTAVPRTQLGFSATLEGSVWKLAWDRAAMEALNPITAVLSIEDGGYAQQVTLAPADLTSGTIFYTPQNRDLTFRLRIDRGGEQIEEHVRVLGAPRIRQTPVDKIPQSIPNKAPIPARADTRGVTIPVERAPVAAAPVAVPAASGDPKTRSSIPVTVEPKEPAFDSTTGRDVKSFPTPVPPSTATAIAIPVPPAIEPRANLAPTPAPAAKPVSDVTFSRAPIDQQTVKVPAAGAVSPSEGARTTVARDANGLKESAPDVGPIPTAATPNGTNYVGPKPVRQVRPQVPDNMPSGVSQVQVLVEIDSRGKVVKVTPIGLTVNNATQMILAERAATFWVFDPAQLNGHAVSSQMSLTFRF